MRQLALRNCMLSACAAFLCGCASPTVDRAAHADTARPAGGITDVIPVTKTYAATPAQIRHAGIEVLSELGFVVVDPLAGPTVQTRPKTLPGAGPSGEPKFSVRVDVTFASTTVGHRTQVDRLSLGMQPVQDLEFLAKENELRRDFFAALDAKLATLTSNAATEARHAAPEPKAALQAPASTAGMDLRDAQRKLAALGYRPGPADGKSGRRTIDAIKKFQKDNGLAVTGTLDAPTMQRLKVADVKP